MAYYESTKSITLVAGEDLRESMYSLLTLVDDGNGYGVVKKSTGSIDVNAVGVLGINPNPDVDTMGFGVSVVLLEGVVKVIANGTITAGDFVVADAAVPGRVSGINTVVGAGDGTFIVGIALQSAVMEDVFEVLGQVSLK